MCIRDSGYESVFAARIAGLFGLMSLAGRLILGPLGERIPRWIVTSGLVLLQILGLLTLQAVHSEAGALVYIVLFGAGSGTMTIMRAALPVSYTHLFLGMLCYCPILDRLIQGVNRRFCSGNILA